MTTPTKTVEVPLTKSEQRHVENIRRRDEKRARSKARQESILERDAKLKEINATYAPKIQKLQDARRREIEAVWNAWRESRASS